MPTKEELEKELASAQRKIARLEKAAESEKEPEDTSVEAQARALKAALKKVPPEEAGKWKMTARALEEAVPEPKVEVQWG